MDRVIGFDSQMLIQMLLQFLNTSVCVGVISYFLYRPVKNFMAQRSKKIALMIETTEDNYSKSDEQVKLMNAELKKMKDKTDAMFKIAHEKALQEENRIIKEAHAKSKKIVEDARFEMQLELDRLRSEMQNKLVDVAWIVISNFLKKNISQTDYNVIMEDMLKKLGDV